MPRARDCTYCHMRVMPQRCFREKKRREALEARRLAAFNRRCDELVRKMQALWRGKVRVQVFRNGVCGTMAS